jgi:hypothetical protein
MSEKHPHCIRCGGDISDYVEGIDLCVWCDPEEFDEQS